ncbi:family 18 glycoside hydrolase [Lojkania enalia]|uniref:chitinase n=1 Tax=Lojkania enalia TaxID=147567 RepID=A0A9P4KAA0_9PLEO|nr:family 18 glycoside hydrolase [Didymosphaeria enalia]
MLTLPVFFSFLLSTACSVLAGFNPNSKSNIVLYWGQNSAGQQSTQTRLSYYCNNGDVDVVLLAFLLRFNGAGGSPVMNFANQGDRCTVFPGTETFSCPEIEADIKTCQSQGKTIILSLGGDSYTEGGYPTADAAREGAAKIWASFGPVQSGSSALRPFGTAVVDGFDFDFEANVNNMAVWANRMRELMNAAGGRKYYLTAAPQCPFPDWYNKDILDNVPLDWLNVQFYNNYCGVNSFQSGAAEQPNFNFKTWDEWARGTSKNRNMKVLVGVPANSRAAGAGHYISPEQLRPVLEFSKQFSSFAGVMMWDASQAYTNGNFIGDVKGILRAFVKRGMRWGWRVEAGA